MEDQLAGGVNKVAGRVQDTVGAATADAGLQAKGKVRQVLGQAQETYGSALDSVREQAVSNPLVTIAIAVGVGFLLGAFWSNRE